MDNFLKLMVNFFAFKTPNIRSILPGCLFNAVCYFILGSSMYLSPVN
jgi:hypothetical protein